MGRLIAAAVVDPSDLGLDTAIGVGFGARSMDGAPAYQRGSLSPHLVGKCDLQNKTGESLPAVANGDSPILPQPALDKRASRSKTGSADIGKAISIEKIVAGLIRLQSCDVSGRGDGMATPARFGRSRSRAQQA